MTTTILKHFDVLNFVKESKKLGVPEAVAEYQGRKHETVEAKEVATKKDIKELELKIEQAKNQLFFWLVGLFVASGIITHFLK